MTKCSLLIPCHNAAKTLPDLWNTVQAQTIPFDEFICYDDGSTDSSFEVAEELGIKVLRGETCEGPAFGRNRLAKETTCDWFHFHDADDLLHPKYLEQTKSRIDKDTDVVLCNVNWIDSETRKLVIAWEYSEEELKRHPVNYVLSHPVGGINGLYRKSAFLSIGGFDESLRLWEDADLHVRLAASKARFAVVEEVLAISQRYSNTLSNNSIANMSCRFAALQKYARQLDSSSMYEIATQAEIVANNLVRAGALSKAQEAIHFCQELGMYPPTTQNSVLELLKHVVPPIYLLVLQQAARSILASLVMR